MINDTENTKSKRFGRVIRGAFAILFLIMTYFVSAKLFYAFLGLFLLVIILSNTRIAVADKSYDKGDEVGEDDSPPVRIYTANDPIGPRTDVKNMNRKELFQSAFQFILFSGLPFFTIFGVSVINSFFEIISETIALVIIFVSAICFMMCLVGGAYMLLLGLLRSSEEPAAPEN